MFLDYMRRFTVTVKQDISRVRVSGGTSLIIYAMQSCE